MRGLVFPMVSILLAGCATSSVVPFSQDTVQISVEGNKYYCGREGVEKIGIKRAAIETIKQGYDSFVILDGQYQEAVKYAGQSARMYGPNGFYGGHATYAPQSQKNLVVKMFKAGDRAGSQAYVARDVLGPDWKKLMDSDPNFCD